MISAIMLMNMKGEVIIYRTYRDDVTKAVTDAFRTQVIARKETSSKPPILLIDKATYLYTRHADLFFVAVTRANVNPGLVFQYLFQMITVFKAYFGEKLDEDAVKNNFTLIYELLDETMDFGYPQNSAVDVLKLYINLGTMQQTQASEHKEITNQITGAVDWRGKNIRHRKNEVFIDVLESVNLLMSSDGNVLRNDVTGQVMMKTYLTGMPECKFGLNDKLVMDRDGAQGKARPGRKATPGVEIDDCTFHRCVRLGKFDADRTITFIPPDGEFELMRYRVTDNVNLPFRVLPVVEEHGGARVSYNIKVIANFSSKLFATNVVITIPTPPNTARAKMSTASGRAKYEAEHRAIVWRIKRFPGCQEFNLHGNAELMASTKGKAWSRPPITLEFQVAMFTASGLHVRFLKVFEKSAYATTKWVRYITRAGTYQVRI